MARVKLKVKRISLLDMASALTDVFNTSPAHLAIQVTTENPTTEPSAVLPPAKAPWVEVGEAMYMAIGEVAKKNEHCHE